MGKNTSLEVRIGNYLIGGKNPPLVQGMTKVPTENLSLTLQQVKLLEEAGAKLIRVAVPTLKAVRNLSRIKKEIQSALVADIHFSLQLALESLEQGVDKIRINPGNIGEKDLKILARRVKEAGVALRIGVNSGSLPRDISEEIRKKGGKSEILAPSMVKACLRALEIVEGEGLKKVVISLKAPQVRATVMAYRLISQKIPYPLHLGITATGPPPGGIVRSALGIGILLWEGIGDTLRVSLTADPVEEVRVGYEILKTLDLFAGPFLISCPTCGRCRGDLLKIVQEVEEGIKTLTSPLKLAVMGCEVNGPGEASSADVGLALGKGGGLIFREGKPLRKVGRGKEVKELLEEIKTLIKERGGEER